MELEKRYEEKEAIDKEIALEGYKKTIGADLKNERPYMELAGRRSL